ncbi:MAG: PAS domain S-box protein [Actinobacteria bacterium]|nr:PAS domain S-box protein [Actinomycetota bacterium]
MRPKLKALSVNEEAYLGNLMEEFAEKQRVETIIGEAGGGYYDLIENSASLIQSVKPDMHYFYVNKAWCEALGYTREEAAGLTFPDIIHPDCHQHCFQIFQKLMSGEEQVAVEVDFISKSGGIVELKGRVSATSRMGLLLPRGVCLKAGLTRNVPEKRIPTKNRLLTKNLIQLRTFFLNSTIWCRTDPATAVIRWN